MPICPICTKEFSSFLNLSRHMILKGITCHDEHESYLDSVTGKDMSVWGHRNDARVARILQRNWKNL